MPKYKLRLAEPGDYLYCEGDPVYVGDTAAEAHTFYRDEWNADDLEWVHPEILRGRVVYARDIEACDCHEDAERGDTTYDLVTSDPARALRPLCDGEIRTWPRGPWQPHWMIKSPWSSTGHGWEVTIAGKVIGEFIGREAAEAARDGAEAELIEAWKANHPDYAWRDHPRQDPAVDSCPGTRAAQQTAPSPSAPSPPSKASSS